MAYTFSTGEHKVAKIVSNMDSLHTSDICPCGAERARYYNYQTHDVRIVTRATDDEVNGDHCECLHPLGPQYLKSRPHCTTPPIRPRI